MKPPDFKFNPNEWVALRKASRVLKVNRTLLYVWVYNYVFKNILYIDGTVYLNLKELEEIKGKIDANKPILPFRVIGELEKTKSNNITYRPDGDIELSNEPNLDLFDGGKQQARKITGGKVNPVSKSFAELPKNYLWIEDLIKKRLENEEDQENI